MNQTPAVTTSDHNKISVVIHTYNAAEHLERVIDSLDGFDEVLVVDMESTDNTVDIARRCGARVLTFPRGQHRIAEPARQFGIDSAAHQWVFEVDADEIVPRSLTAYLKELVGRSDAPDGVRMPRRNFYLGREMHAGYPDHILRFFRRDKSHWPPEVHSMPQVDGRVDTIPASRRDLALIHLANENVSTRAAKDLCYSDYEVMRKAGRRPHPAADLLWRPAFVFFKRYLLKGAWRDGARGLAYATQAACYEALICCKLLQNKLSTENGIDIKIEDC